METKESTEIYLSVFAGTLILLLLAIAVIIFFIIFKKRLVEQQLHLEKKESDYRLSLLKNSIEITEKEQKRIAGDLHDEIGTHLSSVRMTLNAIRSKSNSAEEVMQFAGEGKKIIDETIDSVRTIAHNLLPPGLETFGLINTANDLCFKLSQTSGVSIELNADENLVISNKKTELALYRIIQELLTNALKHAAAKFINVTLTQENEILFLNYKDDGKGFDYDDRKYRKGLGLKNIESRTAALLGTTEFISEHQKGFICNISIPYQND